MDKLEKEIREAFDKYRDSYGVPHITYPKISQNGMMWLAEELVILKKHGYLRDVDTKRFLSIARDFQLQKGLFRRHPDFHNHEQDSPDNYTGILTGASITKNNIIAQEMYVYGQKRTSLRGAFSRYVKKGKISLSTEKFLDYLFGWINVRFNYNNESPGTMNGSSWLGRFPGLMYQLHVATKTKKPSKLLTFTWFLDSLIAFTFMSKKHTDPWRMMYLQLAMLEDEGGFLFKIVNWFFNKRLKKIWPIGIKECRAQYFKRKIGSQFPWIKYSEE